MKVVLEGERRDRCTNVHLHTVNMPEKYALKPVCTITRPTLKGFTQTLMKKSSSS